MSDPNPHDACESFKAYNLSVRREAVAADRIEQLEAMVKSTQEAHKIALQEAFKEGERVGYLRGLKQRTEALNPSSENLR